MYESALLPQRSFDEQGTMHIKHKDIAPLNIRRRTQEKKQTLATIGEVVIVLSLYRKKGLKEYQKGVDNQTASITLYVVQYSAVKTESSYLPFETLYFPYLTIIAL